MIKTEKKRLKMLKVIFRRQANNILKLFIQFCLIFLLFYFYNFNFCNKKIKIIERFIDQNEKEIELFMKKYNVDCFNSFTNIQRSQKFKPFCKCVPKNISKFFIFCCFFFGFF